MRKTISRLLAAAAIALVAGAATAQDVHDVKGIYLLTDYPAVTIQPGTTSTLSLQLRNYGLPPSRLALRVDGVPQGWTATLLGGGQPVAAAMPATGDTVSLQLRLKVPADGEAQPHTLTVVAQGDGREVSLPLSVSLAKELPAKLTLEPSLPALKGGARSAFDYQFSVKNDSGRDLTVSFDAKTPDYFRPVFTEGYGSQQISSVPIKAGQSKDIKLSVHPPSNAQPGDYPIAVSAEAQGLQASANLSLQIVGQPELRVTGRDGLMSGTAEAGKTSTLPVLVTNTGGAAAEAVQLSASAPSGWRVEFDPKTIDRIEPGKQVEAQARVTPSPRSLAGDYMAGVTAQAAGESASGDFRIAVETSSTWGIVGLAVIAVAVLILVGAVARFGRR